MLSESLPRPGKSSDVCETPEVFGDIICVHTIRNSLLQVDAILVIVGVARFIITAVRDLAWNFQETQ